MIFVVNVTDFVHQPLVCLDIDHSFIVLRLSLKRRLLPPPRRLICFCHCWFISAYTITPQVVDKFLWIFLREWGCFTSIKPFDFNAAPVRDPDSGFFNGIFITAEYGQYCKNFAGSAALAELCSSASDCERICVQLSYTSRRAVWLKTLTTKLCEICNVYVLFIR